jgi:hypothetical protein
MSAPPWQIEGYVTPAGNRAVQEWFWDDWECGEDGRNAIKTRMSYLVNLPKTLWKKPEFEWFGDIGEVRKSIQRGALRVYGFFPDDARFVFLLGNLKKKNKDQDAVRVARKRLRQITKGEGSTHEFVFTERTTESATERTPRQSSDGGGEPF